MSKTVVLFCCYRACIVSVARDRVSEVYCLPAFAAATFKTHLIDVLQFIDDLIYDRVQSFHFDFGIYCLSLNPIAHHAKSIAVGIQRKREKQNKVSA